MSIWNYIVTYAICPRQCLFDAIAVCGVGDMSCQRQDLLNGVTCFTRNMMVRENSRSSSEHKFDV